MVLLPSDSFASNKLGNTDQCLSHGFQQLIKLKLSQREVEQSEYTFQESSLHLLEMHVFHIKSSSPWLYTVDHPTTLHSLGYVIC